MVETCKNIPITSAKIYFSTEARTVTCCCKKLPKGVMNANSNKNKPIFTLLNFEVSKKEEIIMAIGIL